jgi:menaquinone-dependent protoporphyrinogen IX oxidase
LIAYANRHCSTGEVASELGQKLLVKGFAIDIRPVETVLEIDHYDGSLLGRTIRQDAWLPEAPAFAEQHERRLSRIPTAVLSLHITALDKDLASKKRGVFILPTSAKYLIH